MSFNINNKVSFIDSFQFRSSSLDSLFKNLSKDDFKYLGQEFDYNIINPVKQNELILMNIWAILKILTKNYQAKKSSLTDKKKICDKEYDHVLKVWKKFAMKVMKDFCDLYLKCDVLLLAYVFQKFRNNCGLCPSHYLSAPALSFYAMVNMTKIKLGLILDPDMYIFFEKDMRGGVSYISNRHSKANNKYLKSYDPK